MIYHICSRTGRIPKPQVAQAIVTFKHKWMSKLCEDHSHFLYHQVCGSIWNFPHDQVLAEIVTNHKVVHFVPIEQISSKSVPWMLWNFADISNWSSSSQSRLANSPLFHCFSDVIADSRRKHGLFCFQHIFLNTLMSIMYLFQHFPS